MCPSRSSSKVRRTDDSCHSRYLSVVYSNLVVYVVPACADDEVWEFEMEESGDCVNAIQDQLSRQGIQGRKTTMAAAQQLERARDIVAEVRQRYVSACSGRH